VKNDRKALVLAGGGVTGIAWELGILAGLADLGVNLSDAHVLIGTSAGSAVAAQLSSAIPIEELYAGQLSEASAEIAARIRPGLLLRWALASLLPGDDQRARARVGKLALSAATVSEADRLAVIEKRLPVHEWPERALLISAVEAETGELAVFDRDSGVPLVDAVAASCAVPMVWPPVTINGRRYVDGGVRSIANADLAKGCGRVVVLAPTTASPRRSGRISNQLATLSPHLHSAVVTPDAKTRKAMGRNPLDPAFRAASAKAGRAQAASIRDDVAVVWGTPPA
jgi:NTE family protein